jgi:hypothetical protein
LGAVIGAVAGGGVGAAVGAGVGGVAGLGISSASGKGEASIPSEAIVMFHLTQPADVTTVSQAELNRLGQGIPQPQVIHRSAAPPGYGPAYYYPQWSIFWFFLRTIWTPADADFPGFAGVFSWGSGRYACFLVVFLWWDCGFWVVNRGELTVSFCAPKKCHFSKIFLWKLPAVTNGFKWASVRVLNR